MNRSSIVYERIMEQVSFTKKSVNQVERELGYPRNALHNYKYTKDISATRLIELAHYFDVSPEYLLGISKKNKELSVKKIFHSFNDRQKLETLSISQDWALYCLLQSKVID